jgi:hypothetical protein
MAGQTQYGANQFEGMNALGAGDEQSIAKAQLRAAANVIPTQVWYATPSGCARLHKFTKRRLPCIREWIKRNKANVSSSSS